MRKLASLQKITNIEPIEGADKIEVASILGWKIIVRKNAFSVGDLAMYFEVDSLIPNRPWSSFLFTGHHKDNEHFRLRTIKMRGQISQGLLVPLNDITLDLQSSNDYDFNEEDGLSKEDADWTEKLGIKKYKRPIHISLRGKIKGTLPHFIKKTDETRIQSIPRIVDLYRSERWVVKEKVDGASCSVFIKDGEFGVCSRNMLYYADDDNLFCNTVKKMGIEERLRRIGGNICLQGELIGPKVQGNPYKLKEPTILFFNVWNIDEQRYFGYEDFAHYCSLIDVPTVPIIDDTFFLHNLSIDDIILMASDKSRLANVEREGLVFKTAVEKQTDYKQLGRVSFKVISHSFAIKNKTG